MLVVFTSVDVRPYEQNDLDQLIEVYQSAFAQPPWNEYMKCSSCNVEYGLEEVKNVQDDCKKCDEPLNLVEYWGAQDIIEDLEFAQKQESPLVLIAEKDNGVVGISWGYKLPIEKFPFLEGKVSKQSNYMDEIAVRGNVRVKGIGTFLGEEYIAQVKEQGIKEIVLRTDERNTASMRLFEKLGFEKILDSQNPKGFVYDPDFPSRVYLRKVI